MNSKLARGVVLDEIDDVLKERMGLGRDDDSDDRGVPTHMLPAHRRLERERSKMRQAQKN